MRRSLWHRVGRVGIAVVLGGWLYTHAAESGPSVTPPAANPSLAPATDPGVSVPSSYRLRSGDTIELRVYLEDDMTTRTRIDTEGFVLLPLIGRVPVRGQTIAQATALIRSKLEADYFHEARTSVLLVDRAPERFLMMGQVGRPGVYDIPPGEQVDLLRAIAMAGGFTKIANQSKITVRRTANGSEESLKLNAKTPSKGPGDQPYFVQADDQLTVGESAF